MTTEGVAARPMIAMRAGANSLAHEGVPHMPDVLQERAGVDAISFAARTNTHGTGGRPAPAHPMPDDGTQEYDELFGGNVARTHPEDYARTSVRDSRSPDEAARYSDHRSGWHRSAFADSTPEDTYRSQLTALILSREYSESTP